MPRLVVFIAGLVALVSIFGWYRNKFEGPPTLNVVTWSGYYSDEILNEFTKKTGIKVQVSYISSNEELFAKLKAGGTGYDLIFPSDYMIEQMTRLSMLQPLKKEWLTNFRHLDPYYENLPYDPGLKYTVPFTRGTTGILVNTEKIKLSELEVSWDLLLASTDPSHTSLLDDMREVFSAALLKRGQSPNTENQEEVRNAYLDIKKLKPKIALFSSEPLTPVLREDITIAHAFSTHAIQAKRVNTKFKYFLPKEGNTVWTDNYAIPVTTKKTKEAHTFIDYFLDPENALKLTLSNGLNTPNRATWLKLPKDMQEDPILYPSESALRKMIFLRLEEQNLLEMNSLWTEVKS